MLWGAAQPRCIGLPLLLDDAGPEIYFIDGAVRTLCDIVLGHFIYNDLLCYDLVVVPSCAQKKGGVSSSSMTDYLAAMCACAEAWQVWNAAVASGVLCSKV